MDRQKITTFFMFNGKAEEAMRFYTSLFVECDSEAEIDRTFASFSETGTVLMPLTPLPPMSRKFGWVQDRYGVSWQLSLAQERA